MSHMTTLKLELGRGAPYLVSGQIIQLDSGKIVLSCVWPDNYYPAICQIIYFQNLVYFCQLNCLQGAFLIFWFLLAVYIYVLLL